jgi:hypothetical protein
VQDKDYYQNEYMFQVSNTCPTMSTLAHLSQDWFTATGSGHDELGDYIELDHDLEFDVYTNSVTGGSPQMQGKTYYTKVHAAAPGLIFPRISRFAADHAN